MQTNSTRRIFLGMAVACLAPMGSVSIAQNAPRIAVTDLAYSERVAEYFEASTSSTKSNLSANRNSLAASSSSSSTYVSGSHEYVEHTELRRFSNEIRGALIKGSTFRLVQGKGFDAGDPQPTKAEQALQQIQTGKLAKPVKQPDVNDIIARIRKGEFAGADYVLFGQVSSIEFRNQLSPLQGTTTTSHQFTLDLLADFSLINTKTLEIKASFAAQGAGNDTKLLSNRGDVLPPNRAKVIRETSLELASDVFSQLSDQLSMDPALGRRVRTEQPASGRPANAEQAQPAQPVTVLR